MQHHRARELADGEGKGTGTFHWVGGTQDCRARKCKPHASKNEAENCQYRWQLDNAKTGSCSWRTCRECKGPADGYMALGGYMTGRVVLCREHRTTEYLEKHTEAASDRWVS